MRKLIIVRGLPGSGKSTFASKLGLPHFEADMYFTLIGNGEYRFDPTRLHDAHDWCYDMVRKHLLTSDVVVSNTFTMARELRQYTELKDYKECAEIIVYRCTGNYGSIHSVPEETLQKMKARFVDYEGEILV